MNRINAPKTATEGYIIGSEGDDLAILQNNVETEIKSLVNETGLYGIQRNLNLLQNSPVPGLSLLIADTDSKGIVSRDNLGHPVKKAIGTGFSLDITNDHLGNSTAVATSGNERWITIFIKHKTTETNFLVQFNSFLYANDDMDFIVHAGTEAISGLAIQVSKPSSDYLILCDVKLVYNQVQVMNADIYTDRTDWVTTQKAVEVSYSDTNRNFTTNPNTVQNVVDEIGTTLMTFQGDIDKVIELQNRRYLPAFDNVRLNYVQDQNRLYVGQGEKFLPSDPALAWSGNSWGFAFLHESDNEKFQLLFKTKNSSSNVYSNEVRLDIGVIKGVKAFWDGTHFVVTYLHRLSGGADIQIKSVKVTESGIMYGTVIDNINSSATYPVKDWHIKYYDVAYSSATDKYHFVWQTQLNRIYFVDVNKSDNIIGTALQLDDSSVTLEDYHYPSLTLSALNTGITYYRNDGNVCFRGLEHNSYILSTELAVSSGVVQGENIHINYGSNYFIFMFVGGGTAGQISAYKVSEVGGLTSVLNIGSFNDNWIVQHILDTVWNSSLSAFALFYRSAASASYKYREITLNSVTGIDNEITAMGNQTGFTSVLYRAGADKNYNLIGIDEDYNGFSQVKTLNFFQITDQGGTVSHTEFWQGSGGRLTLSLLNNPLKNFTVKLSDGVQITDHDGSYVEINDMDALYVEIDPQYFTDSNLAEVQILTQKGSLNPLSPNYITPAYNKVIIAYRWDKFPVTDSIILATGQLCTNLHEFNGSGSGSYVTKGSPQTITGKKKFYYPVTMSGPESLITDKRHFITKGYIEDHYAGLKPGDVILSFDDVEPDGFISCVGASLLQEQYPETFKRHGFRFGYGTLTSIIGTVTITQGDDKLYGTGTSFLVDLKGGSYIYVNGEIFKIIDIFDNATLQVETVAVLGHTNVSFSAMYEFKTPDARGYGLRFSDFGVGRDPDAGSRASMFTGGVTGDLPGTYQDSAMQKHKHIDSGHVHSLASGDTHAPWQGAGGNFNYVWDRGYIRTGYANLGDPTDSGTGGGTPALANETRMMNLSFNLLMKVG